MRFKQKFTKYISENILNEEKNGYEHIKNHIDYEKIFSNFRNNTYKMKLRLSLSKLFLTFVLLIICSALLFSSIPSHPPKNNVISEMPEIDNKYMNNVLNDLFQVDNIQIIDYEDMLSYYSQIGKALEGSKLYEIEYSNEVRYLSGYLDKNIVDELYEEWRKHFYTISKRPPIFTNEGLGTESGYWSELVDDEDYSKNELNTINRDKITGRLLFFIMNVLDNYEDYLSLIKWYEYTDDSLIKKEIDGLVPIVVIAEKKITFNKQWNDNIDIGITIPAYFFYSYYIIENKEYLTRNNQYVEKWIDSYTNGRQIIGIPVDINNITEEVSLNKLFSLYFTKDLIKYCYTFSIVKVGEIDCVRLSKYYKTYESYFVETYENYYFYSYNEFMEIYISSN